MSLYSALILRRISFSSIEIVVLGDCPCHHAQLRVVILRYAFNTFLCFSGACSFHQSTHCGLNLSLCFHQRRGFKKKGKGTSEWWWEPTAAGIHLRPCTVMPATAVQGGLLKWQIPVNHRGLSGSVCVERPTKPQPDSMNPVMECITLSVLA